jgi:hypothetical protein
MLLDRRACKPHAGSLMRGQVTALNLTRTPAKGEIRRIQRMKTVGRKKAPSTSVKRIVVEIDP